MTELVIAILVFLASHALPALPGTRARLVAGFGERPYIIAYSVVSLGVLAWTVSAFLRAPYIELWPVQAWARWVPVLAMPFACLFVVGGLAAANPLSLAFRAQPYDPARPGLVGFIRHPAFSGMALWAAAHIPPNGDLRSLLFFGLLLALSLYGPIALDRKRKRELGEAAWRALLPGWNPRGANGWVSGIIGGAVLYAAFIFTHDAVTGASALP